jgi:large subunit ribosomal protein L25
MAEHEIVVEPREMSGKGPARQLRKSGKVPGILYGHKETPLQFAFDPNEFSKRLRASGRGKNTLFRLKGLDRDAVALIKDLQVHPVRREITHLDFLEVRSEDTVVADVPVRTTGRSAGQVAGGNLQLSMRTVKVRCNAFKIPEEILIDVTPMQLNETFRVGQLELPKGVTSVENERLAIVAIKESRTSRMQQQDGEEAGEEEAAVES